MKTENDKHIICSQKDLYKTDLRRIPGIPLIYFNRSVITLDQPSKNSNHFVDNVSMVSFFYISKLQTNWVFRMKNEKSLV